ncbi:MAG: hypothetical protein QXU48_00370 [Thermoplasmata archaeon]
MMGVLTEETMEKFDHYADENGCFVDLDRSPRTPNIRIGLFLLWLQKLLFCTFTDYNRKYSFYSTGLSGAIISVTLKPDQKQGPFNGLIHVQHLEIDRITLIQNNLYPVYFIDYFTLLFSFNLRWADRLVVWAQSPKVNILAIDYYPGTWVWASFDQWTPPTHLFNIANSYGKKCAIMETGYSTWCDWLGHGRDEQVSFINTALPQIRDKAIYQNCLHSANKILLCTWYELIDNCELGWPYIGAIEDHFGILTSDMSMKEGYRYLQIYLGKFGGI